MPLRRIPPRAIVLVLLIFSVCSVEPVNAFPFSARQSAMVSTMAKSVIVQISGMEKPFATYHESSYGLTVRYRQEAGDLLRTQGGKQTGLAKLAELADQPVLPGMIYLLLFIAWMALIRQKVRTRDTWKHALALGVVAVSLAWAGNRLALWIPGWQSIQQWVPLGFLTLLILATALASWVTGRWWTAAWPEPLWAVLPPATLAALFRVSPMFWVDEKTWSSVSWYIRDFFLQAIVFSAGVFLILVGGQGRKTFGKRIPIRNIVLAAFAYGGILVLGEAVLSGFQGGLTPFFGLITLVVGGFGAVIAVGLGIVFTAAGKVKAGALLGVWGVLSWLCIWLIWMALGAPWFP